jgi:hypothetical protein
MLNRECSFVARIESAGEFLGTGILIAPQYVVTCFHVVGPEEMVQRDYVLFFGSGKDSVEQRPGAVEAVSPSHDLALLRLDECATGRPVQLVRGLTTSPERDLSALEWHVLGYSRRDARHFLRSVRMESPRHFSSDHQSGVLIDAQVGGGLHAGFSGGPVVLVGKGAWLCLGMACLGGEGAATSRIILADCIVGFLEKRNVEIPQPLPGRSPAPWNATLAVPTSSGSEHAASLARRSTYAPWTTSTPRSACVQTIWP